MTLEAMMAALVAMASLITIAAGTYYWRESGDAAPMILMPALVFTLVLYSVTVAIEIQRLWSLDIRIYYRLNAFLLVFAILTTFGVRIIQRRNGY